MIIVTMIIETVIIDTKITVTNSINSAVNDAESATVVVAWDG